MIFFDTHDGIKVYTSDADDDEHSCRLLSECGLPSTGLLNVQPQHRCQNLISSKSS